MPPSFREYFEGPKGASRPSVEAGGHHGSGGAVDDDGRYLRPANTDPLGSLGDGSSLRITDDSVLVTAPLSGSASFTGFHVRDRTMARLSSDGGGSFPPELEAWSEKMGLSAATQAKVLAYLCNEDDGNFGANCMGDLKNLKSEHIEHIVDLVPPAKKRVARQVLKAAGGAGAAHWW